MGKSLQKPTKPAPPTQGRIDPQSADQVSLESTNSGSTAKSQKRIGRTLDRSKDQAPLWSDRVSFKLLRRAPRTLHSPGFPPDERAPRPAPSAPVHTTTSVERSAIPPQSKSWNRQWIGKPLPHRQDVVPRVPTSPYRRPVHGGYEWGLDWPNDNDPTRPDKRLPAPGVPSGRNPAPHPAPTAAHEAMAVDEVGQKPAVSLKNHVPNTNKPELSTGSSRTPSLPLVKKRIKTEPEVKASSSKPTGNKFQAEVQSQGLGYQDGEAQGVG